MLFCAWYLFLFCGLILLVRTQYAHSASRHLRMKDDQTHNMHSLQPANFVLVIFFSTFLASPFFPNSNLFMAFHSSLNPFIQLCSSVFFLRFLSLTVPFLLIVAVCVRAVFVDFIVPVRHSPLYLCMACIFLIISFKPKERRRSRTTRKTVTKLRKVLLLFMSSIKSNNDTQAHVSTFAWPTDSVLL